MPEPLTVLIGSADLLPTLKERTGSANGNVLSFTDTDALRALEAITKRRPHVVALERVFAATPRGAALINRIKADPALMGAEIRVIAHDSEYSSVLARPAAVVAAAGVAVATAVAPAPAPVAAVEEPAAPLDQRGTRRAPRFRVATTLDILVDGNAAALVDLSTCGAQVISAGALKPNQRIRVAMADQAGTLRFNAAVAWAKFEIPPGSGPRYRAGIDFVDANPAAIEAYCGRHRRS